MVFDACLDPLPDDLKLNFPYGKEGGSLNIFVLMGTQMGFSAYTSWKFSELFAEHVAVKLTASNGMLRIPEDLLDFYGKNGMVSSYSTIKSNNFVTLKLYPDDAYLKSSVTSS